jgi:hypothetical protein
VFVGPLDPVLQIDHLCRVRDCVNPTHLEQVTSKVNNQRGNGMAKKNAKKTHCLRGHAFGEAGNLVLGHLRRGWRQCRICTNMRERTRYHRKKSNAK